MKKTSAYIPGERSGKWSEDEHMKYIIFIDYNKEKMRSKEKRRYLTHLHRSNKFYEEMAHFISTRNSLQCRSHHQKLEEKYTHVNKIIALFKPNFNKVFYKKYLEQLDIVTHEKHMENLTRYSLQERTMVDQEIQTDIQDVSCDLVMVNPNLVIIQNKNQQEGSPMSQPMNYQQMPYFQPQLYPSMENPMQAPPPPYPSSQMWWGGYSSNRF